MKYNKLSEPEKRMIREMYEIGFRPVDIARLMKYTNYHTILHYSPDSVRRKGQKEEEIRKDPELLEKRREMRRIQTKEYRQGIRKRAPNPEPIRTFPTSSSRLDAIVSDYLDYLRTLD